MTAIELKTELYQQIDAIADDESLLTRIIGFVKSLKRQNAVSVVPYTMEELDDRISESLKDIESGKVCTSKEVHDALLDEFEWLR
ncbi:MAG: hypothetical protein K6A98_08045 [Prevotella sp.]|nr:hypothetical protein [Prevotella sp.]